MSKQYVITIGRQCGSGGHTIGKQVAERLNIPFYDKELVKSVAQRSGLSAETIEIQGEYSTSSLLFNVASNGYSAYSADKKENMPLADQINAYQTELIQEWAEKGSCVIVGRCADYILRDRESCFRIFICGEWKDRVKRVIQEYKIDEENAEAHVKERDKKRARYYKHITDLTWGMAENYDLCLNSSKLGIDQCVEAICSYLKDEPLG